MASGYLERARSVEATKNRDEGHSSHQHAGFEETENRTPYYAVNAVNAVIPPAPLDAVAHRDRWDMEATVAYIVDMSDEKREVYRAALAFDTEALKRADALRAAGVGQSGRVGSGDA